jgi:hypothetical protein
MMPKDFVLYGKFMNFATRTGKIKTGFEEPVSLFAVNEIALSVVCKAKLKRRLLPC